MEKILALFFKMIEKWWPVMEMDWIQWSLMTILDMAGTSDNYLWVHWYNSQYGLVGVVVSQVFVFIFFIIITFLR